MSDILKKLLKKAEDDSDINGSTRKVLDVALTFGETSENAKRGLPDKKARKYGKTTMCRGKDCNRVSTGGGLFCDGCRSNPNRESKPGGPVQYAPEHLQRQIWKEKNKEATLESKAEKLLKEALINPGSINFDMGGGSRPQVPTDVNHSSDPTYQMKTKKGPVKEYKRYTGPMEQRVVKKPDSNVKMKQPYGNGGKYTTPMPAPAMSSLPPQEPSKVDNFVNWMKNLYKKHVSGPNSTMDRVNQWLDKPMVNPDTLDKAKNTFNKAKTWLTEPVDLLGRPVKPSAQDKLKQSLQMDYPVSSGLDKAFSKEIISMVKTAVNEEEDFVKVAIALGEFGYTPRMILAAYGEALD